MPWTATKVSPGLWIGSKNDAIALLKGDVPEDESDPPEDARLPNRLLNVSDKVDEVSYQAAYSCCGTPAAITDNNFFSHAAFEGVLPTAQGRFHF